MKFAAIASFTFASAVAAQNSTTTVRSGCVLSYYTCATTRGSDGLSANQAQCAANNEQCIGDCYAAFNVCRNTRVDGLSANQAQCVANYATCLGQNPVASTGGLTILPYTATASLAPPPSNATASAGSAVYTTQVVTAITTVCPAATAGPYTTMVGPNMYTVSSQTTITVTNCPCTVSMPVALAMPAATASGMPSMPPAAGSPAMPPAAGAPSMPPAAVGTSKPASAMPTMVMSTAAAQNGTATAASTQPAIYTGAAAAQVGAAGFGLFGAAAAAAMLL